MLKRLRERIFTQLRRIPILGHLTARSIAWIHFKLAGITWAIYYATFLPPAAREYLPEWVIWVWLTFPVGGGAIGIAGVIYSRQPGDVPRKRGPQIEIIGLIMLALGPLIYFTTQVSIALGPISELVPDPGVRWGAAWLGYFVLGGVIARATEVVPRFNREVRDMTSRKHQQDESDNGEAA